KVFFPIQDTGMIQGISEASQSISFNEMSKQQQALANIVLQDPAVENVSSFIGIDGINTTLNSGRLFITLKPLPERHVSSSEIIHRLQPHLATVLGAKLYLQPVQDLSVDDRISRNQYQYSLSAPDITEVNQWTKKLINQLNTSSELQDVTSDIQNLGLQTYITIDRDTASRLGISTQTIDATLYDAFGQRLISTMFTQRNQYYVILENMPDVAMGQDALKNIYIHSGTGAATPLSAFTHISSSVGNLVIHRQDQFPSATVSFNLAPNTALGNAMRIVDKAKNDIGIPPSIQTEFEGSAKIFESSLANEIWLILAAIVVVYIVLGVLYESYIHPITILSTLPSACMGALLTLILTGHALSIIAIIGIILLIGIVMKNAIMMIDFALEQERFYKKTPLDAIYEASLLRFRPIIMTTFASILGAFPLAFGSGMGAELRQPLGIVIISGLLVSQILTLYTTPVIYLGFDKLARQFDALKLRLAGTKGQLP
ncbi:MAG: efflux RND transporter permease subunit, partial [Gammaproteobacteria bacterium]|nr:efflux RND transporter permease subunit [Gammaproteobacteria bacterium]